MNRVPLSAWFDATFRKKEESETANQAPRIIPLAHGGFELNIVLEYLKVNEMK
jgi:hypothetical protein